VERWRLRRWVAIIMTPVVLLLGHVVVPHQLSLLSARHGWAHGMPGWLNLLGVIPIAAGAAFLVWCFRVRGPYGFTRNPMYLFGLLIWLGWIIFYGSVAVLAGMVIIWGVVALLAVRWEQRNLETRFGEAYLHIFTTVSGGRRE
jgi:protein-S-isoprenylcysteine O-methyltransferase Ste14